MHFNCVQLFSRKKQTKKNTFWRPRTYFCLKSSGQRCEGWAASIFYILHGKLKLHQCMFSKLVLKVEVKSPLDLVPTGKPLIRLTCRYREYLLNLYCLGDIHTACSRWPHRRMHSEGTAYPSHTFKVLCRSSHVHRWEWCHLGPSHS